MTDNRFMFLRVEKKLFETANRAIRHYGVLNQLAKVSEECWELEKAVIEYGDWLRNKTDNPTEEDLIRGEMLRDNAVDEVADVLFMAIQAAIVLGVRPVSDRVLYKVDRLNGRIDEDLNLAANDSADSSLPQEPTS